ncbi:hypothetical protein D3C78_891780 [compost metagenome]
MGKCLDGGVGGDNFGHRQVFFHHVVVGNISGGFGGAEDESGVLHREEPLGDKDITGNGHAQGQAENAQHHLLVSQGVAQPPLVQT